MERRILKFNPRIEDIPEELRRVYNNAFDIVGVDEVKFYSKIVKIFFKSIIRKDALNAVVISEPFWLKTYGRWAIDSVERVAYDCGLEFWTVSHDSDEFSYSVINAGYPVEIKDYRSVFTSVVDWEKKI